jgi:hypothetical protein
LSWNSNPEKIAPLKGHDPPVNRDFGGCGGAQLFTPLMEYRDSQHKPPPDFSFIWSLYQHMFEKH